MGSARQIKTACLQLPAKRLRAATCAAITASPPFSCQPPLSHMPRPIRGGARLPANTAVSRAPNAKMARSKRLFQSIAFRCPHLPVSVSGSRVRVKRSVTSNTTSASTCCIWVSMCRRSFSTSRTCCTDVQDSNSHSRASPGDPGLLCPLSISAPALSPQKHSSFPQEPHIRRRNWSVESGRSISTRVKLSVFGSTFSHFPFRSAN